MGIRRLMAVAVEGALRATAGGGGGGGAPLENLEAELDRMEGLDKEGLKSGSIVGAEADDLQVVFATGNDDTLEEDLDKPDAEPVDDDGPEEPEGEELGEPKGDERELSSYSRRVRARIQREESLRKEAETREETERAGRIRSQNETHESHKREADTGMALVDMQIKETTAALKAAKDGGKVDDEIAAQSKLSELQGKRARLAEAKDSLERSGPPAAGAPNQLANRWQGGNRWFDNPEFMAESQMVRAISTELARKGVPPSSEQHFIDLDRELKRRMPNLAARVRERLGTDAINWRGEQRRPGGEPARRGGPRLAAPGQQAPGFGGKTSEGKRQVVLTPADLEGMRKVRLDPTNKTHVLQYAREKAALNSRTRGGQGG